MVDVVDDPMEVENCVPLRSAQSNNAIANLVKCWNTTTRDISCDTRCHSVILSPLPLIEVGVVNDTGLLLTSTPGEGNMALWAPHLVAPLDLADHHRTTRARLCVLGKELRSGDVLGLALVG